MTMSWEEKAENFVEGKSEVTVAELEMALGVSSSKATALLKNIGWVRVYEARPYLYCKNGVRFRDPMAIPTEAV